MKPIVFLGDSLKQLKEFPEAAMQDAGYQLHLIQTGKRARDTKPMPSIGLGVEEIRIWDGSGSYRVIYTARFAQAIYVLHSFQKKTRATNQSDIEIAQSRYKSLRSHK